jgi:hypothetical protein
MNGVWSFRIVRDKANRYHAALNNPAGTEGWRDSNTHETAAAAARAAERVRNDIATARVVPYNSGAATSTPSRHSQRRLRNPGARLTLPLGCCHRTRGAHIAVRDFARWRSELRCLGCGPSAEASAEKLNE